MSTRLINTVEMNRLLSPSIFTLYFTWGYPDCSGRIALLEGDRVTRREREGSGGKGKREGEIRTDGVEGG